MSADGSKRGRGRSGGLRVVREGENPTAGRTGAMPARVEYRPPGRPTRLTKDLQKRIIALVAAGNFASVAASAVGVPVETYYRWLRWGTMSDGELAARFERPSETMKATCRAFAEAIRTASSVAETDAIGAIVTDPAWQARAWYLERTRPDRYGRHERTRVELTGEGGGPVALGVQLDSASIAKAIAVLVETGALPPGEIEDGELVE
jgi:hypothetical protein